MQFLNRTLLYSSGVIPEFCYLCLTFEKKRFLLHTKKIETRDGAFSMHHPWNALRLSLTR